MIKEYLRHVEESINCFHLIILLRNSLFKLENFNSVPSKTPNTLVMCSPALLFQKFAYSNIIFRLDSIWRELQEFIAAINI